MSSQNDPRARELTRLKLALATFALQLDAFEQQAHGVLRSIGQPKDEGPRSHKPWKRGPRKGDKVASQ